MDTYDLFRKLSTGASFREEAYPIKTEVQLTDGPGNCAKLLTSALDFFGDSTSVAAVSEAAPCLGKRKREESESSDFGSDVEEFTSADGSDIGKTPGMFESGDGVVMKLFADHTPVRSEKCAKRKKKKKLSKETKQLLRRQEANAFRNSHRIYVSGPDIPDAVESFQQLFSSYALPGYMAKTVTTAGYLDPTPIQMQAIPLLLQSREVLACAPTGSGKTAAFILPILANLKAHLTRAIIHCCGPGTGKSRLVDEFHRLACETCEKEDLLAKLKDAYIFKEPKRVGFRAVVVSPTRELAQQTYRECVRLSAGSGFRVHVLTKAKANANTFGSQTSLRFDILVTTPNRLVHMLSQEPPAIQLHNVEWLVLDEADKLFEDGHSGFKDQVAQIYRSCDHPDVKHALFSATLASGVEEFCRAFLDNPVRVIIGLPNSATDLVKQELLFVGQESGKLIAIRDIIHKGFTPPMLVFVQSIDRAKELFHELIYDGLNVDVIHSERTQAQRNNVVKCFRSGKIWILICTDVMGRGIDFKGVNLVLNYDFPPTAVSYIHRIGRTGRAGRQGKALTFFTEDDSINLRSIANVMQNSGCKIPQWMLKLKKPSKNTRKKLSKKPLVREQVKTVSKYDLQRSAKRKEMIAGSKRRTKQ